MVADTAADERWLAAMWPFVRDNLPRAPARVLELGCGPLGGFVPRMLALGYDCVGVDPAAPGGPEYDHAEFEHHEIAEPFDAVVASTSLHHVADVGVVLDRIASALVSGGKLVIIEWAHERFDEATARWCIERVAADNDGWLGRHRDQWQESGQSWDRYFRHWVAEERMHTATDIVAGVRSRFEAFAPLYGPYFFADLDDVTSADEQAAIDAGSIQATGLRLVAANGTREHNSVA